MKKAVRVSEVTEQFTAEYQSETAVGTKTEKTNKEETTMTRLTVKELREQAKAAGIKGYSRMRKAELEAALGNQAVTENSKEERKMTVSEYYRNEQRKLGRQAIEELRASETSTEKLRILEEADLFTLEGIARELEMALPQMPDEAGLRARLTAKFITSESTETEKLKNTSEVAEELRTAEKESEIKAILEGCTQDQLHEVYIKYTGRSDEIAPSDWSKEATVRYYTVLICENKEHEKQQRELTSNFATLEATTPEKSSEATETDSPEVKEYARIVICALRREPDASKREEMLRGLTDETLISEIAKELHGADYVRELLIKELCGKTEAEIASKPVNAEEFKKAFDELERGKIFVNIPELRKKLNWPHDVFDEMLRELRDDREIQLHVTDLTIYEPEEFFYDEDDNSRMGMVTWKDSSEALREELSA